MVSLIISTLSTALIARLLGPTQYGYIPFITSLVTILILFFDFGLSPSAAFHIRDKSSNKELLKKYFYNSLILKIVILSFLTVILIIVFSCFSILKELNAVYIIVPLLFFLLSFTKYFQKVSESFMFIRVNNVFVPIMLILEKAIIIVFIYFLTTIYTYFVIHIMFTFLIILMMGIYLTRQKNYKFNIYSFKKNFDTVVIKSLFKYSFPLLISAIGFYIYIQSDILMIQYFLGVKYVSYYSISSKISSLIIFPASILGTIFVPRLVKLLNNGKNNIFLTKFLSVLKFLSIIYMFILFFIIFYSKDIILILYGSEYLEGQLALQIYSLFMFFYGVMTFISVFLDYLGEAKIRSILLIISAVSNILLNLYMIPNYGINGAAVTTQITYIPYAIVCIIIVFKKVKLNINLNFILWIISLLIMIFLMFFMSTILISLTNQIIIRIAVYFALGMLYVLVVLMSKLLTRKDILNITSIDI
jgi:O-antigen/teichoic acid export membrane protein